MARHWYEKAKELGSDLAQKRLDVLMSETDDRRKLVADDNRAAGYVDNRNGAATLISYISVCPITTECGPHPD